MKNNLIVDCNNLLHRVFWVCNKYDAMSVPKMFYTCVKNYMEDFLVRPENLYLAWDNKLLPEQTSYRKTVIDVEYKATRDHEKNKEVYNASSYIRDLGKSMGLCNIYPGCLEADDVMAFLAMNMTGHSIIVTVDQDLLQIIDKTVDVYDPIKKRVITHSNFTDYYPVALSDFIHYKAIMGDKSDNIPGLPKVGPKRAALLIENGLRLDGTAKEIYERNMTIMDLKTALSNHSSEVSLYKKQLEYHIKNRKLDRDRVYEICKEIDCYDFPDDYIDFYTTSSTASTLMTALS